MYGSQEYGLNFHKNGFTPKHLKKVLSSVGLDVVVEETHGYNILVKALFKDYVSKGVPDSRIEELSESGFGGAI